MASKRRAEQLLNYVSKKYGLEHLGQLRALASIPAFRKQASVGFDMTSFERVVTENHGIILIRKPDGGV